MALTHELNTTTDNKDYQSPWWLPGGHLQTLYPYLFLKKPRRYFERIREYLPDGDFLDFDWINREKTTPTVVILHGLEGNSQSHYVTSLTDRIIEFGWRSAVVHFRGCSGEANNLPRAYHSGDSSEIDNILTIINRQTSGSVFFVGYSLGGNVLVNWLGRNSQNNIDLNSRCKAFAAVSIPYNLVTSGIRLSNGITKFYGKHFTKSLKTKASKKIKRYKLDINLESIRECRTLMQFDDRFTAPIHGFNGVLDYWSKSSSQLVIQNVKSPLLILHSENDPFLPGNDLVNICEGNSNVELRLLKHGGHTGFVTGPFPGNLNWLPNQLINYFETFL